MPVSEQDLDIARKLIRMGGEANRYIEGYNAAVVDVYVYVKQNNPELAEQLRKDIDEKFKYKYPVDWSNAAEREATYEDQKRGSASQS